MEDFILRAQQGELTAFDRLVEHYQDAVCGAAFSVVGSFEDAQDVAQEAFLQAWRDLADLSDAARFGAWLCSITLNRARDHLRRKREQPVAEPPEQAAPPASDPAENVVRAALRASVIDAIRSLSEPFRVTVSLYHINGYSISEVASFLDVPEGTVKRRLHEARKRLKEAMMDDMVRDALHAGKPGPELQARIAEELRSRRHRFDQMASATGGGDNSEWARWWHDRRIADVRANAAQYGIEADEDMPRMLPEYRRQETFRDDMRELPRRWGIPPDLELVTLRDLCREIVAAPLSVLRWEEEGLPALHYYPWVLYDRPRVLQWLEEQSAGPAQETTAQDLRTPLLTVLRALADGTASADEGRALYEMLQTAHAFGPRDPVWASEWDAAHERERRENAAQYGLARPTDGWFGIPWDEARKQVCEIRDLSRRIGASPIDIVRWTRAGMPCLRESPLVRWDVRHATRWLTGRGLPFEDHTIKELDITEQVVCEAVAAGEATPEEGWEALSGRVGVV